MPSGNAKPPWRGVLPAQSEFALDGASADEHDAVIDEFNEKLSAMCLKRRITDPGCVPVAWDVPNPAPPGGRHGACANKAQGYGYAARMRVSADGGLGRPPAADMGKPPAPDLALEGTPLAAAPGARPRPSSAPRQQQQQQQQQQLQVLQPPKAKDVKRPYNKPWLPPIDAHNGVAQRGNRSSEGGGPRRPSSNGVGLVVPDSADPELMKQLVTEVLDKTPGVKWEDIAGLDDAKRVLHEAAVLPLLMPEVFTGIRSPPKGVLLFGPPGTGKTMLAKAVATYAKESTPAGCTFFKISSATLGSKWRGESERLVRCLFDLARANAPAIIFIDEVDGLCSQRGSAGEHEASRRVKEELLIQIDGIHVNDSQSGADGEPPRRVMVLAATNLPWDIDEAMKRRLEYRVYIPPPEVAERHALLQINLKGLVLGPDVDLQEIAKRMEGYSGSDITSVCKDACRNGIRKLQIRSMETVNLMRARGEDLTKIPVVRDDFVEALSRMRPSVRKDDLRKYESWRKEFGAT